ncbi:unnamed protein product [Phaedon cochleariae]|uniref:Zinc finger protein n=1 Tax=Phaedon cochleariae TaxID=80249 RepID=A0A9N9SCW3_PHACE|nr:unnamed protein product [Phaedon cochleariae]
MEEPRICSFQSCCRLCLSETLDSLLSIFDESIEDRALPQKISQCLSVEINVDDKLSKMICVQCLTKVNSWHTYKDQCEQNQCKLQEWLANNYQNATPNGLANVSLQIKEEPSDENENEDPENRTEMILQVKREPVESNEVPMEEEYNELPPPLSPNPPNITAEAAEVSPVNEYCCSLCSKVFVNRGNKKRHEVRVHGMHKAPTQKDPAVPLTNGTASSTDEDTPNNADHQKIQFAAGLKLLQKNATPISCEALSKIELSYVEKCKAMANMHQTLTCACHNVPYQNLKGLLSHLRALRIWFPVFTCYSCMITFTDRSTFTKHILKCPSQPLDTITKLSNLRKRSEVKTRLYQNFKCTSCKFMYSFHDTFCKHVDEDHALLEVPVHCRCGRIFDNLEDYKDHVYVSCLVEYYCDICFITTKTLDEFQKHATEVHDQSEGFILLQDDNYKIRKASLHMGPKEEAGGQEKREKRSSIKIDKEEEEETPKTAPNLAMVHPSTDTKKCPICGKEYSSYKNMMRHYKIHTSELELKEVNNEENGGDESFYSCPDCGGMYNTPEWQKHLNEKHKIKTCAECGKCFQFKSEFEQHRSTHLNLKLYRDSKTQAYRSTMISPGSEEDELQTHHQLEHEGENMEVDIEEEKPKMFNCGICLKDFGTFAGLWDHNKKTHPEKTTPSSNSYPKQCPECDKVCTTGAAFYRHKQIHEKDIPADASYNKIPGKVKKTNDIDEESYHTCKKCFKVFSSKYNLKCHMKCHGINLLSPSSKKSPKKPCCNVCQRIFNTAAEVSEHKAIHHKSEEMPILHKELEAAINGPVVFTCDVCVMTFSTKIALKKHKETHLQEGKKSSRIQSQLSCKYCKITFDSIVALTKHMHIEHEETAKPKANKMKDVAGSGYSCELCKKTFQTVSALNTHIGWHKRDPASGSVKVMRNQKMMKKIADSVNVKQETIEIPKFQCATCLAELPNDTALQVHILEKHRSVSAIMLIPRCNTCNKDFSTQDEYETHKRLHDFLERQKQHEQNLLLQRQEAVSPKMEPPILPLQKVTSPVTKPGKSYPCKYCNAGFSRSDTLGAHVRQHHKEYVLTEFKCHQCDRVFDKQNSLSIHLKVHEKQRAVPMAVSPSKPLFSCSICNMGFNLPKDLRAHTITAHPF